MSNWTDKVTKLLQERDQERADDILYEQEAMKFFSDVVTQLKKEASETPQRHGLDFFEPPSAVNADTFKLNTSKKAYPMGYTEVSFDKSKRKISVAHRTRKDKKSKDKALIHFDVRVEVAKGQFKLHRNDKEIDGHDIMEAFFGDLVTELV